MHPSKTSRLRLAAEFLAAYGIAVLIVVCLFSAVTLVSGHFSWEVIGTTVGFFPAGLFVLFIQQGGHWPLPITGYYITYISVAVIGTALKSRMIFWVFVALLLINVGGCGKVLFELEKEGWHCNTNPQPTLSPCVQPAAESATSET
jgi:hypothetical protein